MFVYFQECSAENHRHWRSTFSVHWLGCCTLQECTTLNHQSEALYQSKFSYILSFIYLQEGKLFRVLFLSMQFYTYESLKQMLMSSQPHNKQPSTSQTVCSMFTFACRLASCTFKFGILIELAQLFVFLVCLNCFIEEY